MSEYTKLFERAGARFEAASLSTEDLLRRRDRKRRNQRILAGVVGLALFVGTVGVVRGVGSVDRSQTPVVPGGVDTGPTETGPTAAPDHGWDGHGLPPEGTVPSTPAKGQRIARFGSYHGFLFVYADGRVIWRQGLRGPWGGAAPLERRLSPEGLELLRSGAIQAKDLMPPQVLHGVPASAWADAEARTYVPSRYAVCFFRSVGPLDPSAVTSMLPVPAEVLLRGGDPDRRRSECIDVTLEEARALDEILREAGLVPEEPGPRSGAGWLLRDGGDRVEISIGPLLPSGRSWPGGAKG